MKRSIRLMVEQEQKQRAADKLFEKEIAKRQQVNNNNNDDIKQQFCHESNALNWDKYEVSYWIGNKIGFHYCKKRFFDENITGEILLYDLNKNNLIQLGLKSIHQQTFMRNIENLRKQSNKNQHKIIKIQSQYQPILSMDINNEGI